ncbi:MAG: D-glycero-beta-D-manno-heptose-7-phosphate kinase [Candidatus Omnitrophica bacterium]|nr:D-glycero-beta-D-manno-heptose-7-phosphate kinase [Candidatus Omnitrophota bacterium]MCM8793804.1 D-glycero-beta-D-manno-heptose-7-phosphate kinase [Candidatus Omnitrophota bacterium]
MQITRLKKIIASFNKARIMVVGDLMLDEFIWGEVERISPEAPVPVVWAKKRTYAPGGAANVACNLISLGAEVNLVGIVGKDINGEILKKELKRRCIESKGIFSHSQRPTTLKTRIIAGHQQTVRVDWEDTSRLPDSWQSEIIDYISQNMKKYQAVIIEDYGKGIITPSLLNKIRALRKKYRMIITVDPKEEHFDYYKDFTAITPNRKETENAIRYLKIKGNIFLNINTDKLMNDEQIDRAGKELRKGLNLDALLITLGEQGMRLFERDKRPYHISTVAREVFDVAGAGDTVIATFTLALSQGAKMREAAHLANFAAGIVVEKLGVAVATQEELILRIEDEDRRRYTGKI